MARTLVVLCAGLWLVGVVLSALAFTAPAQGDGFLRGLDRVEGFLTWQFAAFCVAFGGVIAVRLTPPPRTRLLAFLGYGPITLSVLAAFALAAVVAWAAFSPPPTAAQAGVEAEMLLRAPDELILRDA